MTNILEKRRITEDMVRDCPEFNPPSECSSSCAIIKSRICCFYCNATKKERIIEMMTNLNNRTCPECELTNE